MSSRRIHGILAGAGNVLVFVIALVLSCWLIHASLPFPEVPVVHTKLAHLREHVNEYDTLFIGSSRMYHQIIPALFDELMAKAGKPTHSFNAGVDGMRPPEDSFVFDRILDFHPKNFRFVFVELAGLKLSVDEDKRGTIRSVYWHDWERLKILVRRAFFQKKKRDLKETLADFGDPLSDLSDHLSLFARNMTSMGRSEVIMDLLRPNRSELLRAASIGERNDGYTVADLPQEMPPQVRADYERELGARRIKPALKDMADTVSQDVLRQMVSKIRGMGAIPVLIVPPTTNKKNFIPDPKVAREALVFDFADIQKYPGLYENRHRQDTDHVNAAGADHFTRLLVDEFIRGLSARQ